MSPEQQLFFMQQALQLGERGRISAPPNPWVGCVLVKEGQIVGEGYHQRPGSPHAEVVALMQAGERAKGATAFVTLEPCGHTGKTPPCAKSLVKAGVKKVVIPFLDPDLQVCGRGVEILRSGGVEVEVGLAQELCRLSLAPYLHHRKFALPYVHLKIAASVDGKICAADGSSKWITNKVARMDVHRLRAYSQAVLVGSKTAKFDQPELTVRHPLYQASPLRVILDSKGTLDPFCPSPLFNTALGKTLIFSSKPNPHWSIECVCTPLKEGKVDLQFVLKELAKRGVLQLLVEGGSEIWTSFIQEQLVQQLTIYQGDVIIGSGRNWLGDLGMKTLSDHLKMRLIEVENLEGNVKSSYLLTSG